MNHGHYILISAIVLTSLGLVWRTSTMLDTVIKLCLFFFGIWGIVERFGLR